MANLTKRVQLLIADEDWRVLVHLAQVKGSSVGQLIRDALHRVYFTPEEETDLVRRQRRVERLVALNLPLSEEWSSLEEEIETRTYEDEYAHGG